MIIKFEIGYEVKADICCFSPQMRWDKALPDNKIRNYKALGFIMYFYNYMPVEIQFMFSSYLQD